ncbi:MAG: hypothetical protein ABIG68_12560, partial [Acidobacteriota bacterium]
VLLSRVIIFNGSASRLADKRILTCLIYPGDACGDMGYVSVGADERAGIVSGDLRIEGARGRVEMGEELAGYLSASREYPVRVSCCVWLGWGLNRRNSPGLS